VRASPGPSQQRAAPHHTTPLESVSVRRVLGPTRSSRCCLPRSSAGGRLRLRFMAPGRNRRSPCDDPPYYSGYLADARRSTVEGAPPKPRQRATSNEGAHAKWGLRRLRPVCPWRASWSLPLRGVTPSKTMPSRASSWWCRRTGVVVEGLLDWRCDNSGGCFSAGPRPMRASVRARSTKVRHETPILVLCTV
jgi:hypothetical protein